jgi:DNA-binding response OmpR family regulator
MDKVLSGRRILIVEDEMLLLMTIEDVLADLGCETVISASTVDKAISLIDGQVFDAAVLDMNLNGTSSHAVAEALAARGVPFVIATGNRDDMWDGFRDRVVIRKPFKYDELVEILARLLPG